MGIEHVQEWQRAIGVKDDGAFGAITLRTSLAKIGVTPEDKPRLVGAGLFRGVDSRLVRVVEFAVKTYEGEGIQVTDGVRTREQQEKLVASGASKTLDSRHLTGDAIDVVPLLNGKPSWHWPLFFPLARAMIVAAKQLGVAEVIQWGAVWDRRLAQLNELEIQREVADYCQRHVGADFIDGPHYQIVRGA